MSALDTPNQPVMGSKELNDCVHDPFKHFWKSNKHNEVGWLLQTLLDKVVKEKFELRDSNSQHRHHIRDLKTSVCA